MTTVEKIPEPPLDAPAIRVMTMPRDTNAEGTIFGGVILSALDQAGYIEAKRQADHKYVTVQMDGVAFKKPVYVGDVWRSTRRRRASGGPRSTSRCGSWRSAAPATGRWCPLPRAKSCT